MTANQRLTPAEEKQVREAQRQYHAAYYQKNKKKILERNKKWNRENPEKVKESAQNYWLRKAQEKRNKQNYK